MRSPLSWLPVQERDALIVLRRELHQHPELAWQEERTAARVAEELRRMGLQPQTQVARTGVVVEIGQGDPVVALRADMDALPIVEQTGLSFASQNPGVMHACGHDAHTSTLVAVARRLVANPPPKGRVRLIFQPAEEGAGGAREMLNAGVLHAPKPLAIYGLHYWSQVPTGVVGVVEGAMMGSVDRLTITIQGKGGHGAAPHTTADPLVAGAYLVTSLQTLVSRRVDPLSPAVVTIGSFHAGSAFNIIPNQAELVGTVRTLDHATWEAVPRFLDDIVHHTVAAMGCTAKIQLERIDSPLINHPEPTALVQKVATQLVGAEQVQPFQTMAGEDFSVFLEDTPGCFFFVGAGGSQAQQAQQAAPHHSPHFLLDEEAFPLGVLLLEACAREALAQA